ncbi:hypothetical protein FRC18_007113 [Serendipita sp. 400]|nr:hypothetical protein FRC18_007113 [Serendipita sp. 400]
MLLRPAIKRYDQKPAFRVQCHIITTRSQTSDGIASFASAIFTLTCPAFFVHMQLFDNNTGMKSLVGKPDYLFPIVDIPVPLVRRWRLDDGSISLNSHKQFWEAAPMYTVSEALARAPWRVGLQGDPSLDIGHWAGSFVGSCSVWESLQVQERVPQLHIMDNK